MSWVWRHSKNPLTHAKAYHENRQRNCQQEPPEQGKGLQPKERKGAQKGENATGVPRVADDAIRTVLNKPAQRKTLLQAIFFSAFSQEHTCVQIL